MANVLLGATGSVAAVRVPALAAALAAAGHDVKVVATDAAAYFFDPADPGTILAEMKRPWLEPSTYEDQHGLVSNVTFVEGLVHFKGIWFAYYGQSDSTLGVATYEVGDRYSALGAR